MQPIVALSDAQMSAVIAASFPLPPESRSAFLAACAVELAKLPAIGDGAVHPIIRLFRRPVAETSPLISTREIWRS
jgi:hypothetical protein